jgi:hypothetical protein
VSESIVALPLSNAPASVYLPNFLFYANLPPYYLAPVADHFWSLCIPRGSPARATPRRGLDTLTVTIASPSGSSLEWERALAAVATSEMSL